MKGIGEVDCGVEVGIGVLVGLVIVFWSVKRLKCEV